MLQFYSMIVWDATFMIGIQNLLYRNKYLTLDVFQCKAIIFISRTTVGRGILALIQGADINNWVLLTLEDSRNIRLYYNWGGNKKELVTSVPGNVRLNDAEWHKVMLSFTAIFDVKGKLPHRYNGH